MWDIHGDTMWDMHEDLLFPELYSFFGDPKIENKLKDQLRVSVMGTRRRASVTDYIRLFLAI
jgi:hypothetical protein